MEYLNLSAKVIICTYIELTDTEKMLVDAAKEAALRAYAPYSAFHVGAAVLLDNGEVVTGNNQENAAFPSGMCAERTTLFYANSRYPDQTPVLLAVAACTGGAFVDEPVTPCGGCRQVLLEVENRYQRPLRMVLFGERKVCIVESVKSLLPLSFDGSLM
ncbi:MAG: cytidine deaminase [Dysgonamonadaceae bacterium]|jgi:cytidine deaminase|nr:cytidine deaminase [Dysgonamonadaceae bacterium]